MTALQSRLASPVAAIRHHPAGIASLAATRHLAAGTLVLALTVAGFFVARGLTQRDARRDSAHRVEIAAAQIEDRLAEATSLTNSLRRFMLDEASTGVSNHEFASNALRWLLPAGLTAAAWAEQVPAADRLRYERRLGKAIVTPGAHHRPAPRRSSYLPATLITGFPPVNRPGIDLRREPGLVAALGRAIPGGAGATPVTTPIDGPSGVFLVAPAPNLVDGTLRPGAVVVFVSEATLRAAAGNVAGLRLPAAGRSSGAGADSVRREFAIAGQQFAVAIRQESVSGAGALLPWLILGAGLVLSASAVALAANRARRARAQDELDRIFTLSADPIAVADFDGYFTRVNPAAERVIGHPREELLARPYLDFVHPDDRARTTAEAAELVKGKTTLSFENRYVRNDGSERVLEWTATPVVEERVIYAVARDATERRNAEREVERLALEQAALRRVATLVAKGVSPADVLAAVANEVERLLEAEATGIARLGPDGTITIVASGGAARDVLPVGTRLELESATAIGIALRTGRSARVDDFSDSTDAIVNRVERLGIRCSVAVPIVVEGALWGSIGAGTNRDRFAPDAEERLAKFTELVATAIANAASRSELAASRRRIVAASDEARRRIERNLHDGTQQHLAALSFKVRAAEAGLPPDRDDLRSELSAIQAGLDDVLTNLQEISRGIHPTILTKGGLGPALRTLGDRLTIPVEFEITTQARHPESIEVATYFVASEALANTTKHAGASRIDVSLTERNGSLLLSVRDDGVGGADPQGGSGLVGLRDRVEALGGKIRIESPPGVGTVLVAEIPLEVDRAEPGTVSPTA
jgi:PAS domain S-box-containing protein